MGVVRVYLLVPALSAVAILAIEVFNFSAAKSFVNTLTFLVAVPLAMLLFRVFLSRGTQD
jgi:hypothetical protein